MTCPPCNHRCNQGRTCPARRKSVVTDEERSLIDAAIAAGMVRKIAYGVRALTLADFEYNGTRLVLKDKAKAKKRLRYWARDGMRNQNKRSDE